MHFLKTYPNHFEEILNEGKDFEIRFNDRNFKVGDKITLKEFTGTKVYPEENGTIHKEEIYTKREIIAKITKIYDIGDVYLFNNYVAFKFKIIHKKGFVNYEKKQNYFRESKRRTL